MKKLIYYPSFEVQDETWLKFALIYLNKLSPIVPHSGDRFFSDVQRRILGETDLLELHRPESSEGYEATLNAMKVVEETLRHPKRYGQIFGGADFPKVWREDKLKKYTLFNEKYSQDWNTFCRQNGLSAPDDLGIRVHRDLGLVYMTILAQTIADRKAISPITDMGHLDRFSVLSLRPDREVREKIKVFNAILQIRLPSNLRVIPLERILRLRSRPQFKERQNAFHSELDGFYEHMENGSKNVSDFPSHYKNVWNHFSEEILTLGSALVSFELGVWLLLRSAGALPLEYVRELIGVASIAGSVVSIRKTWQHTKAKRYCRKFLADLTELNTVL